MSTLLLAVEVLPIPLPFPISPTPIGMGIIMVKVKGIGDLAWSLAGGTIYQKKSRMTISPLAL
jgi:hypothetical protein